MRLSTTPSKVKQENKRMFESFLLLLLLFSSASLLFCFELSSVLALFSSASYLLAFLLLLYLLSHIFFSRCDTLLDP